MLKFELYNDDTIGDPPGSVATDAEIEITDQLRYRLEERYLGSSSPHSPLPVRSGKDARLDPSNAARGVAQGRRLQRTIGGLKLVRVRRSLRM